MSGRRWGVLKYRRSSRLFSHGHNLIPHVFTVMQRASGIQGALHCLCIGGTIQDAGGSGSAAACRVEHGEMPMNQKSNRDETGWNCRFGRIRAHLRAPQAGRVRARGGRAGPRPPFPPGCRSPDRWPRTAKRLKRKTERLAGIRAHLRAPQAGRCPRYARTCTLGRQVNERWFTVQMARRRLKSKPES